MLACYPLRRFSGTIGRRPLCFCLDSGLRAGGLINQCHMPYRIGWPPPSPPKDSASEGSLERNLPYATQVVPGDVSLTRQPWALHQPFSHGLYSPRAVATTAAQVQRRHSMRRYRGKRTRPTALETTVTLRLSLGGARPPARPPSWCVPLPLGGSPPPPPQLFGNVRKCSENVRNWWGRSPSLPPGGDATRKCSENVRKRGCTLPLGGGSCKNVRKCLEMFGTGAAAPPTFPRAGHTSPRANTENLQKLKDPAPA